MKIISTCLVLLLSGFAFSQFNRTFMHATPSTGNASFTNYSYSDAQNKVNLVSFSTIGSGQVQIAKQRISVLGDVEAFDKQAYNVTLPATNQNNLLLTAIEQGNELYYVLEIGSTSTMKLIWLKVNKNTGALISTITSTTDYKLSYFEPKLVGNELVTYMVKSTGGFVRVALNTGTFTAPTEEIVNASITAGTTYANTVVSGFKSGNLFLINGLEKVVCSLGFTSTTIFTRTAANTYTSVNTGIGTTQRSVSSFLVDPTTIGITNGINIEHYNAAGTMTVADYFSWPANSIASQVEFINNHYHIYYKYTNTNRGIFFRVNQSFQILDSASTQTTIYHIFKNPNGALLVGSDVTKGLSLDIAGNPEEGRSAYCEFYHTFPLLHREEYEVPIQSGSHVNAMVGLGTKVITSPNGLAGLNYNGISACYNLTERFVGFTDTDTLANDRSSFNDQYDELPGPYTTNSLYDEVLEAKYNRPYHLSLQMIQDHIDSVQSGSSTYIPVWEIRNWPAHGNTALGQAANLAPFVDANSNGIYEPLLGDYPSIYGNDCVFSMTHYRDNGNTSKALEFHSYVYTQLCDTNETFDNVLMRKVKVFSRGAELDSLFFGGLFDGDLGSYNDDYSGTNVDLGMIYNYNGDLNDEDYSGRIGFHDTLPAQGIMVLKGFKQANDGLDNGIGILPGQTVNGYGYNDGIVDNEYTGLEAATTFTGTAPSGQADPTSAEGWYNVLNGLYQFGDQMYYSNSSIPTKYIYPGDQDTYHYGTGGADPGFGWYEGAPTGPGSSANPPGDRRNAYSFGKTALSNGEFVELDYAYLIQRQSAPGTVIFEPVTDLFVKASAIRSAFLSNNGPCGMNFNPIPVDLGIEESTLEGADLFTVYPNPTTGVVRINGISETGGTIQVFDINGKLLQTITNYQAMQTIDLSGLDGNIFILRISNESKTAQKRVVRY
jgi:hypothetical protein